MSQSVSPKRAQLYRDRGVWVIAEEIGFPTLREVAVVVPRGFRTDLGSVPRWLWPIIGPHELSAEACILHDFLCKHRGRVAENRWTSRETHRQFLADMLARDVPTWRALLAFSFVRTFGPRWK